MEPVLFNSQLLEDKAPFGAVKCGQKVSFRVRVDPALACKHVEVAFECAPFCTDKTLVLHKTQLNNGYDEFCGQTSFASAGVRFYYLRLICHDKQSVHRESVLVAKKGEKSQAVLNEYRDMWQLTVYEKDFCTPAWSHGATAYQIFPDRFFASKLPDNTLYPERIVQTDKTAAPFWDVEKDSPTPITMDYFGGDLQGILQKLSYLKSLGVTLLYLNPIFEAHSNHRYNTADYHKIDPFLGDEADFCRLCQAAKALGMRIILDGVFSHTGADSVYFNQNGRYSSVGAAQSKDSPYRSWFCFESPDDPTHYKSWWGFETLPETNEQDPSYTDFITNPQTGVLAHWQKAGASGWRLDVADELPDPFIEKIRAGVKQTDPQALLIGEVWEDASNKISYGARRTYLLGKGLDSVMNYPFRTAILQAFASYDAQELCFRILEILEHYPKEAVDCLLNSLSTHDTERIITALAGPPVLDHPRQWQAKQTLTPAQYALGVQKVKCAYLLLFMLPGIPCVYYGDEIGMQGYKDPFNRAYMRWDSPDTELLGFLQKLGAFRQKAQALQTGAFAPYYAQNGVFAFVRKGQGAPDVFCAVNITPDERVFPLEDARLEISLTNALVDAGVCTLPPFGYLAGFMPANADE